MINVAVLGYGTVGSGVVEVIENNNSSVSVKAGEEMHVKYILDLRDFPGDPYEDRVVHDFGVILKDEEIGVVCEVMGGVGAAYQYTRQALEAGKSVCTSNKELVAKHGAELLEIARRKNCSYMFEASVGGGIPIIRPINKALTAERLESVSAILNGTTNYILTRMEKEGAGYEESLKKAQELGYAERDPAADVEGYDACRKIAILSSLMVGRNVDAEKIYTEGITKITAADFAFAKEAGMTVKLLAQSRVGKDGRVAAMVAPALISREHPLAVVNDVYNGVFVTGNMLGDVMFYGRGAGKLPTASAVVSDVIDCARHIGRSSIVCIWEREEAELTDIAETDRAFFIRASAGAREAVEEAFPGGRLLVSADRTEDFGYITRVMREKDFAEKRAAVGSGILNRIRIA
ncbi:MAG: homoserine dehydrogenase [bacterium]|nr:homoserine dehydrogenase [bacterium]